ncbi:MAG: MMPL family transporter [Solirubrobacteraceae bacterium]
MRPNLAERAARWSARHWKTATFGWLAFVLAASVLGQLAGTVKLTDSEQASGEVARAETILARGGFHHAASEKVLIDSDSETVGAAGFQRTLARVTAAIERLPQARDVSSPATGTSGAVSQDGHAALVQFDMSGDPGSADERVQPVLDTVSRLASSTPGYRIVEFGDASAKHELNKTLNKDFSHAEMLSIPITFLIMLLAFGAFVAAGLPVLLAFSAVLGSLGISAAMSHLAHASGATSSVMLLMGMAVGVDYSLFYLKREREERRGLGREEALFRAAATSGRAVLVSGTTVLIAMAGMLMAGSKIFSSIGIGAMIVVLVTMLGSLTVLPALLGKLGDSVERGVLAVLAATLLRVLAPLGRPRLLRRLRRLRERRTLIQRLKGERGDSRAWQVVLRGALRRPAACALAASVALLAMAVPMIGIHTRLPSFTDLPKQLAIVKSYERIQHRFPGAQTPAVVAIQARDVQAPAVREAIAGLERRALASGQMNRPIDVAVSRAKDVERLEIPLQGNGADARSIAALETLRNELIPASVGRVAGVRTAITGETAGTQQFNEVTKHHWPLVFAFVLGLAFLLLLITFRSIVIPATAIVLNLLSVGAAYGVLVWIFQDGHLQGLLGFHSNGAIVTWLPLFLFAVLFGLSMDYHVFIVSRIKELAERGASTEQAVERGIAMTAGTVTSAAGVMVAVFAIFATLSTLEIKQMGVGLAVAVLIDATVIRAILLPATMKLLGRWNWYLPRWLEWLPAARGEQLHGPAAAQEA